MASSSQHPAPPSASSDSASMPPPSTVPSQSSSRKRKRHPPVSSSDRASAFSAATRHRISDIYPDQACWHCAAKPADAAHVITRRDHHFAAYKSAGLLTIDSLSDLHNAVSLCPTCHRNFDDHTKPGFVFFPADLGYFRLHEERDAQRRREKHRLTRAPAARSAPTAADYLQHQRDIRAVDHDSIGGLYERYVLRDYLPCMPSFIASGPRLGQLTSPAAWHGDPMAALRRAFAAVSSPISRGVPFAKKKELINLRMLYEETDATYQTTSLPPPSQESNDPSRRAEAELHGASLPPPQPGSGHAPSRPSDREEASGADTSAGAPPARSTSRRHLAAALLSGDDIPTPPYSPPRKDKHAPLSEPAEAAPPAQMATVIADGEPSSAPVAAQRTADAADDQLFVSKSPAAVKRRRSPLADSSPEQPASKRLNAGPDDACVTESCDDPADWALSTFSREGEPEGDDDDGDDDDDAIERRESAPCEPPQQGWRWGPGGTANEAIEFYRGIRAADCGHRQPG